MPGYDSSVTSSENPATQKCSLRWYIILIQVSSDFGQTHSLQQNKHPLEISLLVLPSSRYKKLTDVIRISEIHQPSPPSRSNHTLGSKSSLICSSTRPNPSRSVSGIRLTRRNESTENYKEKRRVNKIKQSQKSSCIYLASYRGPFSNGYQNAIWMSPLRRKTLKSKNFKTLKLQNKLK